jgi:hypothetical protein
MIAWAGVDNNSVCDGKEVQQTLEIYVQKQAW